MTAHVPPLHPDERDPVARNPLLRGIDLAIDRLIRRDTFTERTLRVLDELREEIVTDPRPLPDRDTIAQAIYRHSTLSTLCELNETPETVRNSYLDAADAVIALIRGDQ